MEFEPEENETDSEQSSNYIIEQQREIVEVTDYAQVKCANIKVYKKVYRRCQKALQQNTSHFWDSISILLILPSQFFPVWAPNQSNSIQK